MADQGHSDSEEVEKWLEGSPIEPPQVARHHNDRASVPWDAHKSEKLHAQYFQQRYSIFSKYDYGIWMTDEAWFGVTPEPVARAINQHVTDAAPSTKSIIIDCFAGVGGNAIAFASSNRWTRVYAIEKDRGTIACAQQNAKIYNVSGKISWIEGDCFEVLGGELSHLCENAVIFASPPWGGPGYRYKKVFNLRTLEPYSLSHLLDSFRKSTQDIVLYLPRTSDLRQLAQETPSGQKTKVIHYCMEGASKALCAYFGDFVFPPEENTEIL
ncbi:MAG: hypothetical protein Q9167_001886 [Letrouitia subvulpina]